MTEQAKIVRVSVCAFVLSWLTVNAQEEAQPSADVAVAVSATEQVPAKYFEKLVRVVNPQGVCEVNNPDHGAFEPVQNSKAYPMGSVFRTGPGGTMVLVFSERESAMLLEKTEVTVVSAEKNPEGRIVRLGQGRVRTVLSDNLPEGAFGIETPNAACQNVAGRGDYELTADASGEVFQVATITGSVRIQGPQYVIPALRAANTVNIHTAPDRSLSRLTSVSGDFVIVLSNGTETPVNFGMSPKAVVKIWRENAPVGGRPIISTLVVSPTGIARHRFVYVEGRPILTTGELISPMEADKKEAALPLLLSLEGQAPGGDSAAKPEASSSTEKLTNDATP